MTSTLAVLPVLVALNFDTFPPCGIPGLWVMVRVSDNVSSGRAAAYSYPTLTTQDTNPPDAEPPTKLQLGILGGRSRPVILCNVRRGVWDPRDGREPIPLYEIVGFPCTTFSNGSDLPSTLDNPDSRYIPFATTPPSTKTHIFSPLTLHTRTGEAYVSPQCQWLDKRPVRFRMRQSSSLKTQPDPVSLLQFSEVAEEICSMLTVLTDDHNNLPTFERDDDYWGGPGADGSGSWIAGSGAGSSTGQTMDTTYQVGDVTWSNWMCSSSIAPATCKDIGMSYERAFRPAPPAPLYAPSQEPAMPISRLRWKQRFVGHPFSPHSSASPAPSGTR
ncbi:hypothetical protein C8R44DRAFT_867069 [Mycena epipterygia]|nr:hypothetical protein C8R44DRAFT_867069 [Mycena epipterygia]